MGQFLSSLSIAALLGVGVGAALAPETLARNYGLPMQPGDPAGRGFVRALGARDATIGAIALAFALRGNRSALRTTLGMTSLLALADFAIVATTHGSGAWRSLATHAVGVVGLLVAAAQD